MKPIHLIVVLSSPFLLSQCKESRHEVTAAGETVLTAGDVSFAKNTFESLARGDSAVANKIDWPVYTSLGDNLGETYVALTTEVEKQQLVTAYITKFASSFRDSGGTVESYTNWRVTFHDKLKTEVAADSPNGVLAITVSERDNVEKVSSITLVK